MIYEKHRWASQLLIILTLTVSTPLIGAAGEADKCFPPCRDGYFCHEAKCISLCNPPCNDNEVCSAEGGCVLRQVSNASSSYPQTSPTTKSQKDVSADNLFEVNINGDTEEPNAEGVLIPKSGFAFGFALGATLCASDKGCKTVSNGDMGVGGNFFLGYKISPRLLLDGGVAYSYMFLKKVDSSSSELTKARRDLKSNSIFNLRFGGRFYPLKRQFIIEPVLGIHFDLSAMVTRSEKIMNNTGIKTETKEALYGPGADISAGVDWNTSDRLSLGLYLTVYKPFYTAQCIDQCAKLKKGVNNFFFGIDFGASFFL